MDATKAVIFLDRNTPPHISTLILLAGISATAMNIFLPSLNHMAEDFGVSYAVMQLSVPLFLFCSGLMQLFIGPVSDRFGRRKVALWGLAVFLLATFCAALAPTAEIFLALRVVQASVGVGIVLSRAVVRDMFEQDRAASMIGYVTMGMALAPMVTPVIGGLMDQFFGWRSSLFLLFALGLGVFWMVWKDLGETAKNTESSFAEQLRDYPELLGSPRFWGYAMSTSFSSGAFFIFLGGAPFIGSEIFGLSSAALGIYFGTPAIGYILGNFLTGRLAGRVGINPLILSGCLIAFCGVVSPLILFHLNLGSPLVFFGSMTLVGVGNGLVIPSATSGMLSVRPQIAGAASGLGGALMIGLGAALSALAGSLLTVETGAFPLLYMQTLTGILGLSAIGVVYWREACISDLQKKDLQT